MFDAIAFDSIGYNDRRLVLHCQRLVNCIYHLLNPVSIYFNHVPIESNPLVTDRIEWHYVFGESILLNPVSIQYCSHIIQSEFGRRHCGFPNLTFI
jgi:hypothetical protein